MLSLPVSHPPCAPSGPLPSAQIVLTLHGPSHIGGVLYSNIPFSFRTGEAFDAFISRCGQGLGQWISPSRVSLESLVPY